MIATTYFQGNEARKSGYRSAPTHEHAGSDRDTASLAGPRSRACSGSCSGAEPVHSAKRFKPNTCGPRTRISFDGAEESFQREGTIRSSPIGSQPVGLQASATEVVHGSQAGSGIEEEDSDEDGNQAHQGELKGNFQSPNNNLPSPYCDLQRAESTSTASTLTSPLTTAQPPCEVTRDLSLGREDSLDEPDPASAAKANEVKIGCKIRAKLAHKADPAFDSSAFLEHVKKEAAKRGFTCMSTRCPAKDTCLTFKCQEGHAIIGQEFRSAEELVCPKCQRLLDRCVEYAKAHNGILV